MAAIPSSASSTIDILHQTEDFAALERPLLKRLVDAAQPYPIMAGNHLFQAHDPFGNTVYILYAGHMQRHRLSGEVSEVLPGEVLGLTNGLDCTPFNSTVEAVTDCSLLAIDFDTLQQLERTYPPLFHCLNQIIADKLNARCPDRDLHSGLLTQPVGSVMTTPISSCAANLPLRDAFGLMLKRNIGSLVVTDDNNQLMGLLTRADLAEAVLLQGAQPTDPICSMVVPQPQTIAPNAPLWRAQEMQQQKGAKYVVVLDHRSPIGMVSQTDILRTLMTSPGTLIPHIAQANSLSELTQLKSRIGEEAACIRDANRWASASVRFLSETHLAIQRRTIELTLQAMRQAGNGEAPLPFAILIMGSGGRKEMLLNPDQDNGLLIADSPDYDRPDVQAWFERLGHQLNDNLYQVGYPLCPGEIMARNPLFRRPLSQWQKQLQMTAQRPTEEAARWSNIVFDFDTLYGDESLTAALRHTLLDTLKAQPRLLTRMAEDDARSQPALGLFNQLITTTRDSTGSHIDLKRNGLRLIIDATRIFALHAGSESQNTNDRLAALVRTGTFPDTFITSVRDGYEVLLDLMLAHQIEQTRLHQVPNPLLDFVELTEQNRSTLRLAMRIAKRFQERLQERFGTSIYV